MPRTIAFEGRTIQVPYDFSDEEISGILSQGPTPKQAAGAKAFDPRFLAPMPAVNAGGTSPSKRVDPRFLTTMGRSGGGATTDPNNADQNPVASSLGMSLFHAAQQNPDRYAYLLHLQDLTTIPPIVSAGNEKEIQQWVDANRIDPETFTINHPGTAVWGRTPTMLLPRVSTI